MLPQINVAAGVLFDSQGRVLLAKRPAHLHQGGLWEFPGGKIEQDETPAQALSRELKEELSIQTVSSTPFVTINHHYSDRHITLHARRITDYDGRPHHYDSQPLEWVLPADSCRYTLPAANKQIEKLLKLPRIYAITGNYNGNLKNFVQKFEKVIDSGISLVQLRLKNVSDDDSRTITEKLLNLSRRNDVTLLVNSTMLDVSDLDAADGIHYSSHHLMDLKRRPLNADKWVAASCHTVAEMNHAARIGVDFIVVSPIVQTSSHPNSIPIGWDGFAGFIAQAELPIFALGGMCKRDLPNAQQNGAVGIAGISEFWR